MIIIRGFLLLKGNRQMPIKRTLNKGKVPVKIYTDEIDSRAMDQLSNMAQLPFIHSHIAVMPDVHAGVGATVGTVIPTIAAIIPAAVGVDIGCGMNAVRLSLTADQLPDNLARIRSAIEAMVPVGFNMHKREVVKASTVRALSKQMELIVKKHPGLLKMLRNFGLTWPRQIGTLGGGNHFIELCLDENQHVWIMLHSGSRGIGNVIGRYFIQLAQKDMGRLLGSLPDKDLAYLQEGNQHFDDYMTAVNWAQDYAMLNRKQMMKLVISALQDHVPAFDVSKEAINCHHNYVQKETHFGAEVYLTRKGAIRAGLDELGIIPGSMGAKSFIVSGRGSKASFSSCSHGAGRVMSRTAAKKRFNQKDLEALTQGVECRKDKGVIDEIPAAYKDIDQVMHNQSDLVDVVHTLKQVVCVKG
jgi:tRNA-splicing ligase RtcB